VNDPTLAEFCLWYKWAHSRDLFLLHPEKQVDSFVLYVKATMLICAFFFLFFFVASANVISAKVKNFDLRFRARHFFGDVAVMSPHSEQQNPLVPAIDPRGSPAFVELDNITSSFRSSFPSHLRNPIVANVVDQHLLVYVLVNSPC
jgi:hypothetical protein